MSRCHDRTSRKPTQGVGDERGAREHAGCRAAGSAERDGGLGALAWLGLPLMACCGAKFLILLLGTGVLAGLAERLPGPGWLLAPLAVVASGGAWLASRRRTGSTAAHDRR